MQVSGVKVLKSTVDKVDLEKGANKIASPGDRNLKDESGDIRYR